MLSLIHIYAHMRAIDEVAKALERGSYGIGDGLTDGTSRVQERREDAQEDAARLRERLKALLEERNLVHRHLLNAFPRLRQEEYKSAFERIQEHRRKKK